MIMVSIMILGIRSYFILPVEEFPDINLPVFFISVDYPGASPEVVERVVTKPLEDEFSSISGLKRLSSYSNENNSTVVLEFNLGENFDEALNEIRRRLTDVQSKFDSNIKNPVVNKFNITAESFFKIIISGRDITELSNWVEQDLKYRLLRVKGVGSVDVYGSQERQINIEVDPKKLDAYGITIQNVISAIRSSNNDYPVGKVKRSEAKRIAVRLQAKIKKFEDFITLPIVSRNGQIVYLSDVAKVVDGFKEENSASLFDGEPALTVELKNISGANIVETARLLRKEIANIQAQSNISLNVIYDGSEEIETNLSVVKSALIEGILITVLVVMLFLASWRSTFITAISLPVSVLGTFAFISLLGFSINLMVLLALILSIGVLIDDAIIVRENIVRHLGMGKSHYNSSMEGTNEIGLVVLATSSVLVAVFFPVSWLEGVLGILFYPFAFTVIVAVVISLFVSFTLDPMLSSIWYDPQTKSDYSPKSVFWKSVKCFDGWVENLSIWYSKVIYKVLDHSGKTMLGCLFILGLTIVMFRFIGSEFIPAEDRSQIVAHFRTTTGSTLEETKEKAKQISMLLKSHPEVKGVYSNIIDNRIQTTIQLTDKDHRPPVNVVLSEIREDLRKVGGIVVRRIDIGNQPGDAAGPDIGIRISGPTVETIQKLSDDLMDLFSKVPNVTNLRSSVDSLESNLSIILDKSAIEFAGSNIPGIGYTLQAMFAGLDVTDWSAPDGGSYKVHIQLPESERTELTLLYTKVPGSPGADGTSLVPLSSLSNVVEDFSPRTIQRVNRLRQATIYGTITSADKGGTFAKIQKILDTYPFPPGYGYIVSGAQEQQQETLLGTVIAINFGIAFMYMILVSQFRSFLQPVVIMSVLPFALIGVVLSLIITGKTINLFTMIGIIMLMGLVAKNGILIVDFINQGRRLRGLSVSDAISEAGRIRLRPLLMTSAAMIAGMFPLALRTDLAVSVMAVAIIGGMASSTILALFVVPLFYFYFDKWGSWISKKLNFQKVD